MGTGTHETDREAAARRALIATSKQIAQRALETKLASGDASIAVTILVEGAAQLVGWRQGDARAAGFRVAILEALTEAGFEVTASIADERLN